MSRAHSVIWLKQLKGPFPACFPSFSTRMSACSFITSKKSVKMEKWKVGVSIFLRWRHFGPVLVEGGAHQRWFNRWCTLVVCYQTVRWASFPRHRITILWFTTSGLSELALNPLDPFLARTIGSGGSKKFTGTNSIVIFYLQRSKPGIQSEQMYR